MSAGIDEGLLSFMMRHCDLADARAVRDENGEPVHQNGQYLHRLVRVGCRLRMTQHEIAARYCKSRQHVNHQIAALREQYFIVNQAQGWYEFDAHLCWCGNLGLCAAYRQVQRVRDGVTITDGTTTLVTEDMDADDVEHSPQRAEEEED